MDVPTVQSIAESIGISQKTLYDWSQSDIQFATELHQITRLKEITDEMERKFPDLKWTEEEKMLLGEESLDLKTEEFLIFQALAEAKKRHDKPENQST